MKQFIVKFYPAQIKNLLPRPLSRKGWDYYWNLGLATVKELETEQGILASGRHELFGAIFGRDSLITSLKLLIVYQHTNTPELLAIVRKVLLNLCSLQGKGTNIESGEEPGKCIHEFRPDNHERLTKNLEKPWYVYPDGSLRNYDTIDATSLLLIVLYRYYQISGDDSFLKEILPNVKNGLSWLFDYGDVTKDGFIDFQLNPNRKAGGLINQSWMDSSESIFREDGTAVHYPVVPVEV